MKRIAMAALAVFGAGCMAGRDYQTPQTSLPAAYRQSGTSAPTHALDLTEWWHVFGDEQLSALITEAAESNLDVRLAQARLREARARLGASRSSLFPELAAGGQYARQRLSENAYPGRQIAAFGAPLEENFFDAALDMSWEIDVFGARRRQMESARAQWQASAEAATDIRVSVLAEMALNYLELRGAQKELEVARQNLKAQEDTLALTRDRFQSGLASELDAARAAAQSAHTRAQIPPLAEAAQRALHRIAVLLGKNPGELNDRLASIAPLPTPPPRVPVGLPSELLRQRPDIRRAERELAAASAEVAAATAEWFPRFYLTGAAGLQSIEATDFFDSGSRYWSLGPGIRWPIFTAGRIRQNIRVQSAREEQALLRYEQTVLNALEEVENALLAFGTEQARSAALAESEQSTRRAAALALDRYRGGLANFLDVLETDRTLLAAQRDLVESERRLGQTLVRLFKALGGGWPSPRQIASRRTAD